jgi:hypothetical protein
MVIIKYCPSENRLHRDHEMLAQTGELIYHKFLGEILV